MLLREAAPKLDDHADMWIHSHKQRDCHLSLQIRAATSVDPLIRLTAY